uniref:Cytochrome c oxidase assembly protein COX19 n=1 Tax=Myotis myotis TaxID=51298 RepID=A0A7J7XFK6_MYOMY|nr:cytochrome c oxidase assembly factor COX19 [Myotis myotis]
MSTAMNFGSKSFQPRPPDKGSFPLDHFGECRRFQEKFMKCLRDNKFENALCRHESKEYLECRMERQVRAPPPARAPPPSARPRLHPDAAFPEAPAAAPVSLGTRLSQRPLRRWVRPARAGAGACARELLPRGTPRGPRSSQRRLRRPGQLMAQEPLEKLGFGDLMDGKADKH